MRSFDQLGLHAFVADADVGLVAPNGTEDFAMAAIQEVAVQGSYRVTITSVNAGLRVAAAHENSRGSSYTGTFNASAANFMTLNGYSQSLAFKGSAAACNRWIEAI